MANWQVISLDTTTPQLRAPGTGDGYSFNSGSTQLGVWTTTGLGIGTASPVAKLAVQDSTAPKIALQVGATERAFLDYTQSTFVTRLDSDGPLSLASNNTEAIYLTSFQEVGVGTQTPDDKLSVAGNVGAAQVGNAGFKFYSAAPGSNALEWFLYNSTSNSNALQLSYYNSGVFGGTVLTANKSGNIGIGTASPGYKLHVAGTARADAFVGPNDVIPYMNLAQSNGLVVRGPTGSPANQVELWTLGSPQVYLNSSGNLGLGVTPSAWSGYGIPVLELPPAGTIVAAGVSQNLGANWYYSGGNFIYKTSTAATYFQQAAGAFKWFTAPSGTPGNAISFTQAMTLDVSGNLLVGRTSTITSLSAGSQAVSVSASASNRIGVLELNGTRTADGNDCGYVRFFNNAGATPVADITAYRGASDTTGTLAFSTGNTERARITSAGNVVVNTAAVATTATDGFLYIPTCAGAPTGVPTTFTGRSPLVVDSTNNRFYVYVNGAWKYATLT